MSVVTITLDEVRDIADRALAAAGMNAANRDAVVEVVVDAERDACHSHGLHRIPGYCSAMRSGRVNGQAEPKLHDLGPSLLRVDADCGFSALAVKRARPALAENARATGVAIATLQTANHFHALWHDLEPLAADGLIAMMFVNSRSTVVHPGGHERIYGTNPMAFAWPRPGRNPLVWDMASAAIARGEIEIHRREGKPIPEGWAIDPDGNPTTDAAAGLAGAQLPFGGYKGANIALMVELMAAAFGGNKLSLQVAEDDNGDGGPPDGGNLIMAFDPEAFAGSGQASATETAERLFARILGDGDLRLPSDRRYAARARTPHEGVAIDEAFLAELRGLHSQRKLP